MEDGAHRRLEVILRVSVVVLLFVEVAAQFAAQPWLHDPTAIGTDTSNYYAAGLRLNVGHSLYGPLQASDRPTPFVPPYFDVPLLSPPTIAIIWRAIALLPGTIAMLGWWALAGISMLGITTWMIWTGSRLQVRLIIGMLTVYPVLALLIGWSTSWVSVFPGIPDSAVSGNVNGYLVVALAAVWWASAANRPVLAGGLAALATSIKLLPVLLLPWFIVTRQWRAAAAFLCIGVVILVVTIVGAGWDNTLAYLGVVRQTGAAGATGLSLPGIARKFGAPSALAAATIPATILGGLVLAYALRHRPGWSFSVIIVAATMGSPVIHQGTFALLLAALAPLSPLVPWTATRPRDAGAAVVAANRGTPAPSI